MKSARKQFASRWPATLAAHWSKLRDSRSAPDALALLDQLIVGGTAFLTILLLGRLAGSHALGVFALIMTIFFLLVTVQESLITIPYTIFGARLTGVRHRRYSAAVLYQCAAWSACAALVVAFAAGYYYFFHSDEGMAKALGAFAIVAPVWLFREFGRRHFFAQMEVTKVLVMSAAGSIAQLATLFFLSYTGRLSAATALLAIGLGSFVAGLGWVWFNRAAWRGGPSRWRYYAVKNWVMGRWLLASHGSSVVAANTMPWLVMIWLGPSATGLFAACDAILRFANPIIISLSNVLTPRAAIGLNDGGKAELNRIVWKATTQLTLFLFAFCMVLALTSEWLLRRSFGQAYAGYWATLVVLAVNQLAARFSLASRWALMLLERANIILLADGVGVAVSLLLAPLLLPRYGSLGAAVALLVSSVASSALVVGFYCVEMRDGRGERFLPMVPAASTATSAGSVAE